MFWEQTFTSEWAFLFFNVTSKLKHTLNTTAEASVLHFVPSQWLHNVLVYNAVMAQSILIIYLLAGDEFTL